MSIPCYSARFIQPFAEVLSHDESFRPESLERLHSIDPTSRLPIHTAHSMVIDQVTQTTAANAEEGAAAAEELNAQSEALKNIVEQLSAMVGGGERLAA